MNMDHVYHLAMQRGIVTEIAQEDDRVTVRSGDTTSHMGAQSYPWLDRFDRWRITTVKLGDYDRDLGTSLGAYIVMGTLRSRSFAAVKDNKAVFVDVWQDGKHLAPEQFLDALKLDVSLAGGGYKMSKRFGRAVLSPFKTGHAGFFKDVVVIHDDTLHPDLWDGAGRVSRRFVDQMAALAAFNKELSREEQQRQADELRKAGSFEVTILHEHGQEKGDVLVDEEGAWKGMAYDFLFPAGSAKPEVTFSDGSMFVALRPRHAATDIRLDVQSLINNNRFWETDKLVEWLHDTGTLFLESIERGDMDRILDLSDSIRTEDEFGRLSDWSLAEYISSGGQAMWFAGSVRRVGKIHLNRLNAGQRDMRFPVPGGRFYIMPASVKYANGRSGSASEWHPDTASEAVVPRGYVELDTVDGRAYVNDRDYLEFIQSVLGGCDADDGVWAFAFHDEDDERVLKVMLWRSPNQQGEYVVLEPTLTSWLPDDVPVMHGRKLPTRIDRQKRTVERLPRGSVATGDGYSLPAMLPAVRRVMQNLGTLGSVCNVLMVEAALDLPTTMPFPLEDVIDGSVKDGLDVRPAMEWARARASELVAKHRVPVSLVDRLQGLVGRDVQIPVAGVSWIDGLVAAYEAEMNGYREKLEELAARAFPPMEVFEAGLAWAEKARVPMTVYARSLAGILDGRTDADEITSAEWEHVSAAVTEALTGTGNAPMAMLGCVARIYTRAGTLSGAARDSILWLQGAPFDAFLEGLRVSGAVHQLGWDGDGLVRTQAKASQRLVPMRLTNAWFNLIRAMGRPYAYPSEVPAEERDQAKAMVAKPGMLDKLGSVRFVQVEDRVVATSERTGNVIGYVPKGRTTLIDAGQSAEVAWCRADDGNLDTVLVV